MNALLVGRAIRRVFAGGDGQLLEILCGIDIEVRREEFVAIVGASGAGKSTLLHLLGALDSPTTGDIWLDGSRYADLDPRGAADLRNRKLGFVFQFHHLLREFSALENVMMPLLIGVLADEPSGNLDHANAERLHEIFFRLAREYETAVVVVTHNRQLAGRADRVLLLEDGRLTSVSSIEAIP